MTEHRFTLALLALTVVLITLGGYVHNTESSLAIPDWPLSYGGVMPDMEQAPAGTEANVAIEHTHRMVATLVGLLTIVLAVLLQRRSTDPLVRALGWAALVLVIVQGTLGGITVLLKLPTPVSTAHLGTSLVYFGTLILIAHRTRTAPGPDRTPALAGAAGWAKAAAVAVYVQALLGALVRHAGGGAALGLGSAAAVIGLDPQTGARTLWPSGGLAQLQAIHRGAAVVVGVLVVIAAVKAWCAARSLGDDGEITGAAAVPRAAGAMIGLVVVQAALGIASVWTFLDVPTVTAHLTGATLLFAASLSLVFLTAPVGRPAPARIEGAREPSTPALSTEGGRVR
jgi:heme A synthase